MSLFSKAKKLIKKVEVDVGLKSKPKKAAAAVDPDPINPLTGRPMSQNVPVQPTAGAGLGQMGPASYLPTPVSSSQRVPQGLGSDVFRSTLAPLQQQNYGLGQVDPRFLQGQMPLPGGSNAGVGFTPAGQQAPIAATNEMMYQAQAAPPQQAPQQQPFQGLGRIPYGNFRNLRAFQ